MPESEEKSLGEDIGITDGVSISRRFYLAQHHLWTSKYAASRCRALETELEDFGKRDIEHESYAVTSVLAAVAFLETLANELFEDAGDPDYDDYHNPALTQSAREAMDAWASTTAGRRSGVLQKYRKALAIVEAEPFVVNEDPYRDASLLIELRNALVHYRPAWHDQGQIDELGKELSKRFEPSGLLSADDDSPWVPVKALGAGGAEWAFKTCLALADAWIERLEIKENYHDGMAWWDEQRQERIGSNVQRHET
jgi:hypothetical protein